MTAQDELLKVIHPVQTRSAVEALLGSGDATFQKFKVISFAGKNGAGAITLTGAAVGDYVIGVVGITAGTLGDRSSSFEGSITVVDQIQQGEAADLSANNYIAFLV